MVLLERDLPPPRINNNSLYPSLSVTLRSYDEIDEYCRQVLIRYHNK